MRERAKAIIMSQILSPNTIKRTAQEEAGKNGLPRQQQQRRRSNSYYEEDEEEEDKENSSNTATGVGQTTAACQNSSVSTAATTANSNQAIAQVMKRSQWKINTSLESKRAKYDTICSICFLNSEQEQQKKENERGNPLITPCLCLGSRARQHKRCIEEWIEETGAASCPFCFVRYEYSRKRKNFWSYLKECELERDFVVSLTAFALSLYLFLVGLSICYHYVSAANYFGWRLTTSSSYVNCHTSSTSAFSGCLNDVDDDYIDDGEEGGGGGAGAEGRGGAALAVAVEKLLRAAQRFVFPKYAQTWLSITLFCFACTTSVLLFIGLISMSLKLMFRHYVSYSLWSKTHFKVSVEPYSLAGSTAFATATTSVSSTSGGGGLVLSA